jgi:hypothetical protein
MGLDEQLEFLKAVLENVTRDLFWLNEIGPLPSEFEAPKLSPTPSPSSVWARNGDRRVRKVDAVNAKTAEHLYRERFPERFPSKIRKMKGRKK